LLDADVGIGSGGSRGAGNSVGTGESRGSIETGGTGETRRALDDGARSLVVVLNGVDGGGDVGLDDSLGVGDRGESVADSSSVGVSGDGSVSVSGGELVNGSVVDDGSACLLVVASVADSGTLDARKHIEHLAGARWVAHNLGEGVVGDHQFLPGIVGENLELVEADRDLGLEAVDVVVEVDDRH
jgi:hypothetical protein